jgi:hypothetical protein
MENLPLAVGLKLLSIETDGKFASGCRVKNSYQLKSTEN